MEKDLFLEDTVTIDSIELLDRFTKDSKKILELSDMKASISTSIDIVTAVYYFRKYNNVDDFINSCLQHATDYFLLQWVRSTWAKFSSMTDVELSDIVINNVELVNSFSVGKE